MRTPIVVAATFLLTIYGSWRVFVPSRHTGGYWTHGIVQPRDGVWSPTYRCTPTGVVGFSNMQVDPHPWPQEPFIVRRVADYDRQPWHSAVMEGESWIAVNRVFEKGFATGIQDYDGSKLILDSGGSRHIVIDLKTGHFIREEVGLRADSGYIDWNEVATPNLSIGNCIQLPQP